MKITKEQAIEVIGAPIHEDLGICFYIVEHCPAMVGGCVVPAYSRVREYRDSGCVAAVAAGTA